jgi:hypothetical protein
MGLAKRKLMEEESRGWRSPGQKFVCMQCILDDYLKDVVESYAKSTHCDYCGVISANGSQHAASIDVIIEHVVSALWFKYNDPAAELPYESAETGFQGRLYSTEDLLGDLAITDDGHLLDDICKSIDQTEWCDRDYFSPPREDILIGSWQEFSDTVKSKVRYLFLLPSEESRVSQEHKTPARTLLEVSKALVHTDSFRTLKAGSSVYRARTHSQGKAPSCARELGPPLPREARNSNRLSPAGIPVFYGALDRDTARAEAAASSTGRSHITSGRFELRGDLTVIDLASDRVLPSIFDEERRDLLWKTWFLREFVKDVSKPIKKDGAEHIDYVPTQIFTEYLRHYVGKEKWAAEMVDSPPANDKDGFVKTVMKTIKDVLCETRIDGMLYRSSIRPGGTCCGLFIDAESCVDRSREKEQCARLVLDPQSLCTKVLKGPP